VVRAATSLVARLERQLWSEHRLRVADFELLDSLTRARDGLSLSEITDEVWLSRSGARLRARALEAAGLVTLGVSPKLLGGVHATISEKGLRSYEAALVTVAAVVRED
jgi:hypothetical protein